MKIEHCCLCDEPTGKGGRHDDSLYLAESTPAEVGPLCQTCRNTITSDVAGSLLAHLEKIEKTLATTEAAYRREKERADKMGTDILARVDACINLGMDMRSARDVLRAVVAISGKP